MQIAEKKAWEARIINPFFSHKMLFAIGIEFTESKVSTNTSALYL